MSEPDWYEQDDLAGRENNERRWRCRWPGECLMTGLHSADECHTKEMLEEYNAGLSAWLEDELREDA